jgi:hypothetical protein
VQTKVKKGGVGTQQHTWAAVNPNTTRVPKHALGDGAHVTEETHVAVSIAIAAVYVWNGLVVGCVIGASVSQQDWGQHPHTAITTNLHTNSPTAIPPCCRRHSQERSQDPKAMTRATYSKLKLCHITGRRRPSLTSDGC